MATATARRPKCRSNVDVRWHHGAYPLIHPSHRRYKTECLLDTRLVTGLSSLLLDNVGELLDLSLGSEKGAELWEGGVSIYAVCGVVLR